MTKQKAIRMTKRLQKKIAQKKFSENFRKFLLHKYQKIKKKQIKNKNISTYASYYRQQEMHYFLFVLLQQLDS